MRARLVDICIALITGLWTAALQYLEPTNWQGVAVRACCITFVLMSLAHVAKQVGASVSLHGSLFSARAQRIGSMFSRTKIAGAYNSYRQQVLNGGIIFFAAIVSGQGSHALVSLATVYIFQLVVLWWAIRHVPPSVLVLGPASQSLAEEVDDLRRALRPHRVILMFPSDRQPSTFEEVVPQVIFDKLDNFRTHFDSNWKDAFRVLLDAAPVVLVDGRSSTANLKFEAEAVAKTGGKAVFLISANSATALLDGLGDAEREFYSRKAVQLDSMDASVVMAALEVARLAKADRDGG